MYKILILLLLLNSYSEDKENVYHEGFTIVKGGNLDLKCNYKDKEGNLLSDEWFDRCEDFKNGFGRFKKDGKYNYLTVEGKYLSKEWFDWCEDFTEGFAVVEKDGKENYLTKEGKYLSDEWFDVCARFNDGYGKIVRKIYKIDTEGNITPY